MESSSQDKKKKPYSAPTIIELTPGQAKKLLSNPASRNDQDAVALLESLRREQRQKEEKLPPNDVPRNQRRRTA